MHFVFENAKENSTNIWLAIFSQLQLRWGQCYFRSLGWDYSSQKNPLGWHSIAVAWRHCNVRLHFSNITVNMSHWWTFLEKSMAYLAGKISTVHPRINLSRIDHLLTITFLRFANGLPHSPHKHNVFCNGWKAWLIQDIFKTSLNSILIFSAEAQWTVSLPCTERTAALQTETCI